MVSALAQQCRCSLSSMTVTLQRHVPSARCLNTPGVLERTDTSRPANSGLTPGHQPQQQPLSRLAALATHEVYLFEGEEGAGAKEQRCLARVFGGVHEVLGPLDLSSRDVLQQGHAQIAGNVPGCGNLVGPCTATQLPAGLLRLAGSLGQGCKPPSSSRLLEMRVEAHGSSAV